MSGFGGDRVGGTLRVVVLNVVRAPVRAAFLRSVLQAAAGEVEVAARLPAGGTEMTLRLTGDRELRRLNRSFLGEDGPTDVLSFAGGEPEGRYLGDLALSWPAAVRQAEAFGHAAAAEAALLAVHGLLHLLGWDHATRAEEAAMWELTLRCLRQAGVEVASGRLAGSGNGASAG